MTPQIQFAGIVSTSTPNENYTPGKLLDLRVGNDSFWHRAVLVFKLLAMSVEVARRGPQPLYKVFGSLPQACENEAVRDFDKQVDQVVFQSDFLAGLSTEERQSLDYEEHKNALFWYVFGYAQAKGWTSINKRMGRC